LALPPWSATAKRVAECARVRVQIMAAAKQPRLAERQSTLMMGWD